jgi:hypothetical protein
VQSFRLADARLLDAGSGSGMTETGAANLASRANLTFTPPSVGFADISPARERSSEPEISTNPHGWNHSPSRALSRSHTQARAPRPQALFRILLMSRNTLPIVIAILAVGAAIIGYMVYQDQQTTGVEIKIGEGGISIEEK